MRCLRGGVAALGFAWLASCNQLLGLSEPVPWLDAAIEDTAIEEGVESGVVSPPERSATSDASSSRGDAHPFTASSATDETNETSAASSRGARPSTELSDEHPPVSAATSVFVDTTTFVAPTRSAESSAAQSSAAESSATESSATESSTEQSSAPPSSAAYTSASAPAPTDERSDADAPSSTTDTHRSDANAGSDAGLVWECNPGATRCDADTLSACDPDGQWQQTDCFAHDRVCLLVDADSGEFGCGGQCGAGNRECRDANVLAVCNPNGEWDEQTCALACDAERLDCMGCTPGDGQCPEGCVNASDTDCPKRPGEACSTGDECSTQHCVDGVCCNSSCNQACFACNASGSAGSCTEQPYAADVDNCGGCGRGCSTHHVLVACAGGQCNGACLSAWGDCNDDKRTDGCETNLSNTVAHCGQCQHACSTAHVVDAGCASGECTGSCRQPWLDCDDDLRVNGCETDGSGDPLHCGGCGTACPYGLCVNSQCKATRWGFSTSSTTSNRGANTLQGMLISIAANTDLVALAIDTATAGAHVRLGLYTTSGGAPQSLVAQTAALTTVDGVTEGRVPTTHLGSGDYWIYFLSDATLSVRALSSSTAWWFTNYAYGSLPNPAPAMNGANTSILAMQAVTTP